MIRTVALPLLLLGIFVVLMTDPATPRTSEDLNAVWLAGHFLQAGQPDAIYRDDSVSFTMLPPVAWYAVAEAEGFEGDVYPFLYPPIWAWAGQAFARAVPLTAAGDWATPVNALLLGLTVWLAGRAARGRLPLWLWMGIGLPLVGYSAMANVATSNNQPQILVAFLIVLAIERDRSGAPGWGGAALALAASIKIYPALLVVLWIAARRWRAVAGFAGTGLGLGLLSIAVAGWPLHGEFLDLLRTISGTAFATNLNPSADALLLRYAFLDEATQIVPIVLGDGNPDAAGWFTYAKPALWSALNLCALGLVLGLAAWRAGRSDDVLVWPIAMAALSFVSPLSWIYHYLAPAAFLPALLDRLGYRRGGLLLLLSLPCLMTPAVLELAGRMPGDPFAFLFILSLGVLILIWVLIRAHLAAIRADAPLHPAARSL